MGGSSSSRPRKAGQSSISLCSRLKNSLSPPPLQQCIFVSDASETPILIPCNRATVIHCLRASLLLFDPTNRCRAPLNLCYFATLFQGFTDSRQRGSLVAGNRDSFRRNHCCLHHCSPVPLIPCDLGLWGRGGGGGKRGQPCYKLGRAQVQRRGVTCTSRTRICERAFRRILLRFKRQS